MKKLSLYATTVAALSLWQAPIVQAQPANDDCVNASAVSNHSVTPFDMTGATRDNSASVSCNGSSTRLDLWYKYTAAGAEQLTVSLCGSAPGTRRVLTLYSGGCNSAELACNEDDVVCGTSQPIITVETPGAGTYYICVSIRGTPGPLTGVLNVDATAAVPNGSDNCGGATAVFDGDNKVRNTSATQDTQIDCVAGGPTNSGYDVWYSYNAPITGVRNFEITSFATIDGIPRNSTLAIYNSCGGTLLACNDDGGVNEWSKIYHFPVTAGVTYKMRFSGRGTHTGIGVLNIAPPPTAADQDDCALATPVLGQVSMPFTTAGLTNSDIQPWDCDPILQDGWFAWTPSLSGRGVVDACGAISDTYLALSLYDACGNVPLICSNGGFNDSPNPYCNARIAFDVTAGQTYYVRYGVIFSTATSSGDMHFAVRPLSNAYAPPPYALTEPGSCNNDWANDLNGGCRLAIPSFTPINLCDTYKGTASARLMPLLTSAQTGIIGEESVSYDPYVLAVDSDWYEFTLDFDQIVTIVGQTEFPYSMGIYYGCPATRVTGVGNVANTTGVYPISLTSGVLPAGVYFCRISQPTSDLQTSTSTCGHGDRYWFTISGVEACTPPCAADFNGDHVRDVADLFGYINAWLAKTGTADFNHDSLVDVADLFGYINAWLAGC